MMGKAHAAARAVESRAQATAREAVLAARTTRKALAMTTIAEARDKEKRAAFSAWRLHAKVQATGKKHILSKVCNHTQIMYCPEYFNRTAFTLMNHQMFSRSLNPCFPRFILLCPYGTYRW